MVSTAVIAELGALVGDPGRANMLTAMLDGRALTARELADRAGISPQTASGHLAKLVAGGMVQMEQQGRHRYHRLASADIAHMLEAMHVAGAQAAGQVKACRTGPADPAMRAARTCYDHLAGRLGVALADALSNPADSAEVLSQEGRMKLVKWGLDLDVPIFGQRPFCRLCLDWSERRPHLAGRVGAMILDHSLALGWVRRRERVRSLLVTQAGYLGFKTQFGVAF